MRVPATVVPKPASQSRSETGSEKPAAIGLQARADQSSAVKQLGSLQRKADTSQSPVAQFRNKKIVTEHAKSHFYDGWGDKMGIKSEPTLKGKVPKSVTGSGSIALGVFDAPDTEQVRPGKIKSKNCSIGYKDGYYSNETKIFACGPLGYPKWRNA